MKPKVNSYFSGAGLLDIGLMLAGLDIQQSYEIDPDACAVASANFWHPIVRCDITTKLVADEKPCDVRAFTYPCTKYSPIASIHGMRTGDELYLHAFRHMAIDPPEMFIAENVPGMMKFPVVMEAMQRLPGYYVKVICPVDSSIWLPQRRERLIIIGSKKPFQWRQPECKKPIRLRDILERDPKVRIPKYVKKRLRGGYRDLPIISDPKSGDIAPTCVAHYGKDQSTRLVADSRFPYGARPYSVREYARLQGVPDWFKFAVDDSKAYRMIGNGVSVPVGEWLGREIIRYFKNN